MKISCDREQFFHAFQTAAAVAPARSPKAILQNVKLEAGQSAGPSGDQNANQDVVLMATDMEIGVRIEVSGVEVETPGAAVIPVALFGSILRESTDEKLHIDANSQGAVVRGERSEFRLPACDPHEFPQIETFTEEKYIQVSARLLKEIVRRTIFATDADSSRYALGGVLLEIEADKILAVATDGRRLAKMEGKVESIGGAQPPEAMTIVPMRSMQLIERALSDPDAQIRISARTNDILIRTPRATIYSRLVEGRFPKWRDVLPKRTGAVQLNLVVGPMFAAVRQAATVSNVDSRGIDFRFGEGTLVLTGSAAETGDSRVEMPIPYTGDPITLSLDHRYVADFLKVLDPEKTVSVEIQDSASAALFQTDDGYEYVIMPLSKEKRG